MHTGGFASTSPASTNKIIRRVTFKYNITQMQNFSNTKLQIKLPNEKKTYTKIMVKPIMSIITDTPDWFLQTIETIILSTSPTPNALSLKFELTPEAATHNMMLLQRHNNSIQDYILHNTGSLMSFGSEFRHPDLLEPLLMHHPNWKLFSDLLSIGSNWALKPLANEDRIKKNSEFITRGNHKSAITYESELHKIISQEIAQGWMLPLPLTYI
jgi:hypothetical protein